MIANWNKLIKAVNGKPEVREFVNDRFYNSEIKGIIYLSFVGKSNLATGSIHEPNLPIMQFNIDQSGEIINLAISSSNYKKFSEIKKFLQVMEELEYYINDYAKDLLTRLPSVKGKWISMN